MNYFKNKNNELFAFTEEQIQQGYGKDLIQISEDEMILLTNPTKTNEQLLNEKISEASQYLQSTDYKMTVDYFATLTKEEQDSLIALRAEARQFIRDNE